MIIGVFIYFDMQNHLKLFKDTEFKYLPKIYLVMQLNFILESMKIN